MCICCTDNRAWMLWQLLLLMKESNTDDCGICIRYVMYEQSHPESLFPDGHMSKNQLILDVKFTKN